MNFASVYLGFALSVSLTILFIPYAIRSARHLGLVDRPDGRLKVHKEPVPYFGGVAMYLAYLLTLSLFGKPTPSLLAILLGGTLMLILGLLDDFGSLPPLAKLFAQIITVFVLIRFNIAVDIYALPIGFDIITTFLWVIVITNAMNLADIMDGLAGGVCIIISFSLTLIGLFSNQHELALISAALCGACIGFIVWNWHPAKIFMGDAGSLFLGITIAILTMHTKYSFINPAGVLVPFFLLTYPLYDTTYVIIMRFLNKRPILKGSKDHMPVRLRIAGWSTPRIVLLFLSIEFVFSAFGLYALTSNPKLVFMGLGIWVVVWLILGVSLARIPIHTEEKRNETSGASS